MTNDQIAAQIDELVKAHAALNCAPGPDATNKDWHWLRYQLMKLVTDHHLAITAALKNGGAK